MLDWDLPGHARDFPRSSPAGWPLGGFAITLQFNAPRHCETASGDPA
jgi:hypothetical protein